MEKYTVLKVVTKFIIPFIMIYAFYVQLHGEYSPGGGFQAGVIFASAFILYSMIHGLDKMQKVLSLKQLKMTACIGALIYITVGFVTLFMGGNFLEYTVLYAGSQQAAQQIGIVIIELGVGLTVFAAMMIIFVMFALRGKSPNTSTKK